MLGWRNWQTRRVQDPVGVTSRGGSNPPPSTRRAPDRSLVVPYRGRARSRATRTTASSGCASATFAPAANDLRSAADDAASVRLVGSNPTLGISAGRAGAASRAPRHGRTQKHPDVESTSARSSAWIERRLAEPEVSGSNPDGRVAKTPERSGVFACRAPRPLSGCVGPAPCAGNSLFLTLPRVARDGPRSSRRRPPCASSSGS